MIRFLRRFGVLFLVLAALCAPVPFADAAPGQCDIVAGPGGTASVECDGVVFPGGPVPPGAPVPPRDCDVVAAPGFSSISCETPSRREPRDDDRRTHRLNRAEREELAQELLGLMRANADVFSLFRLLLEHRVSPSFLLFVLPDLQACNTARGDLRAPACQRLLQNFRNPPRPIT